MKTVSIENCLDVIPNKFKLSLIAMDRAKRLMLGAKADSEYQNIEKNSYVALKEIEDGKINLDEAIANTKADLLKDNMFKKNVEQQEARKVEEDDDDGEDFDMTADLDNIDFTEDEDDDFDVSDDTVDEAEEE